MSPEERDEFLRRFQLAAGMTEDGCWGWNGRRTGSYHTMRVRTKVISAHRAAYEVFVGPIPKGLCIDHKCNNRWCVNPAHLQAITLGDNVLRGDGITARLARRDACPNGHPFAGTNVRLYNGARVCRTCKRENARSRYRSAASGKPIVGWAHEGFCKMPDHCTCDPHPVVR